MASTAEAQGFGFECRPCGRRLERIEEGARQRHDACCKRVRSSVCEIAGKAVCSPYACA